VPYPYNTSFFENAPDSGKKYRFNIEPKYAIQKYNQDLLTEQQNKQLNDKVDGILEEKSRLKNLYGEMILAS